MNTSNLLIDSTIGICFLYNKKLKENHMKKMHKKKIKTFNPIAIIVFVIGMLCSNLNVNGQVPLISASDGGFENATSAFANNGWTAVGTSARTWRVGTAGGAATGTKAAYWGTAAAYGGTAASAVGHFYRDVIIPAGATNVLLNYKLKYPTIDGSWDYFYVFATTNANTPVNAVIPTTGYTNLFTNTSTAYAGFTAMPQIDLTSYAGTTVRLVFTFKTDAATPNAAPAVDDITLTYIAGSPCSGTPAPGNTISTANPICSGINFSLSLQNTTTGSGISYQWQSSPNNITWTNIAGATSSTFTGTQTIATYYHCLVTCSGNTGTSTALLEGLATGSACIVYCTNVNTTNTTYMINNFSTTGGITNITNNSSGFSTGGYGNFTAMSASQVIGSSVNFYTDFLPAGYTYGIGIWIDWNQNGSFADAGEQVYISGTYVSSATGTITVPVGATPGITRMRVVSDYIATSPTACTGTTYSECEDYNFNVILPTGCTGTPAPGNTISSTNPICTGVNFTLSLQNTPTSSGITFQWQSSPDNITWTNISGATAATYTGTQTASTYYHCLVTCSGNTGTSTALQVNLQSGLGCLTYCASAATVAADEELYSITVNGASTPTAYANANGCTTVAPGPGSVLSMYSNFKTLGNLTSLTQGATIPFTLVEDECDAGTYYANGMAIWIDWNQNGSFTDVGEQMYTESVTTAGPRTITNSFIVPAGATLGQTVMRIVVAESYSGTSLTPCLSYGYGETEDWVVNVVAASPCAGTPAPGNTISSSNPVCASVNFTLSLQNITTGSGVTYQWQSSPDNVTWTNITGTTSATYTGTETASTYYHCLVTCSGNTGTSTALLENFTTGGACLVYCDPIMFASNPCNYLNSTTTSGAITNITVPVDAGYNGTGVTFFPSPVITQDQGASFTLTVQAQGTCLISYYYIWADWNQNGTFEPGEMVINNSATNTGNNVTNFTINIPITAVLGTTRMRIICWGSAVTPVTACDNLSATYGETEDYRLTITLPLPCTGTPVPGNTIASANPICSGVNFMLSLQNNATGSGVTYQWQSSPDNITWTNITGANSNTYTGTQTASTYYQCLVTCSGNTGTSTALQVNLQTGVGCLTYCTSSASTTADEELYSITINGASTPATYANVNGCTNVAPGPGSVLSSYSNFKTLGSLTNLSQGTTVPFTLVEDECDGATYYSNGMAIWIDWNQNGSFTDVGEKMYTEGTTTTGPRTVTNSFIVPAGATLGQTIMRITVAEGYNGASLTPCLLYSYGETEDWVVTVVPPPLPTITSIGTTSGCPGSSLIINGTNLLPATSVTIGGTAAIITANTATSITVTTGSGTTGTVTVTTASGTATSTQTFTFLSSPTAVPTCNSPICEGSTLNLTGSTDIGTSYNWSGPNGYSSVTQNGSISSASIINSGIYSFTATANGCFTVGTTTVVVNTIPSSVTANSSSSSICNGSSIDLTSSGVSNGNTVINYNEGFETFPPTGWTFINAGTGNQWISSSTSYTGSNSMSYNANTTNAANAWGITQGMLLDAGTSYNISFYYGTAGGATYPENLKITVGNSPTVAGQTTILWNPTNLTAQSWTLVTIPYTPAVSGTYYFGLNCYSAANMYFLFIDDLSVTGGTINPPTFSWTSSPAGFTSSNQNPTNVTPSATTQYIVTAQNIYGCTNTASTTVTVNTPPTPTVSVVNNCGNSVLTASAYTGTLLWNNGETNSSITVTTSGTYSVIQTLGGCTSSPGSGTAAPITIPTAPTVSIANNCGSSTLTATGYTGTLLWSTSETTPSISTTSAGTFTVTQTENGCTSIAGSGTAAPLTIPTAPIVNIANNCGSSTLTASGYTGTLLWNTSETTPSISTTSAGTFTVTQTENGCTSTSGSGIAAPIAIPLVPVVSVANSCEFLL